MTTETQLRREIADRVIDAKKARIALDINAIALDLARKYTHTKLSVEEIRDELEQAATAQGTRIST